jgi:hypothetical protein
MSIYQMYFLVGRRTPYNGEGPPLQFHGDTVEQAVKFSERVVTELPPNDPAVAFCLVDSDTNRIVHQGLCQRARR